MEKEERVHKSRRAMKGSQISQIPRPNKYFRKTYVGRESRDSLHFADPSTNDDAIYERLELG